MSLILEALKKSEQQRRLGTAPTLGTPAPLSRRRRSLLPLLAVLIVGALAAGWWFTRTPSTPAPVASAPAVDPTAPKPAPANPPAASTAATPAPPPRSIKPVTPRAPDAATAKPATPAAPILPMPTTDRPGSANIPPNAAMVAGPKPAPPAAAPAPARTPPPAAATKPADAIGATATPARTPVPNAADATHTPPAATHVATAKPAAPALPSVWELPYTTRKELPDLKLTMHVFSSVPAERFIVIEGARHVEGDDLGNGVVLREISTDGMVLDFKGQRFVYPRDGR